MTLGEILMDKSRDAVVFMAPAVRAGIGEFLGRADFADLARKSVTALKTLGFSKVFDMSFSADITTLEETTELLLRIRDGGPLPQFTSCCPGWFKIAETRHPELAGHLSTTKSPQAIFGSLLREFYKPVEGRELAIVSLVPCVVKKIEAERADLWATPERRDVDAVFTTKEFADMAAAAGLDIAALPETPFDEFGESGSGVIYGSTGGVASAIVRTALAALRGGFDGVDLSPMRSPDDVKKIEIPINDAGAVPEIMRGRFADFGFMRGRTLRAAIVHSVPAIERVAKSVAEGGEFAGFDFIEFMMCPGGCVGGAGQKKNDAAGTAIRRAQVLGGAEAASAVKSPLSNPALLEFYGARLPDGPCSREAARLFHRKP
ncbi:MAG: hypothetical protein LBI17_01850 [Rickettsiales bacterium]|jgi:NADH-quinone oxidoreductase subunit G/[NiFe] hydrogenase diaphorase moiety small subunit|nr:hypothetical protein [Rickettsiales bacterium]